MIALAAGNVGESRLRLPQQYAHLQQSAAALHAATAAAQLAHSITARGGAGDSSAGGAGRDGGATEAAFQQWYLSAFADSFAPELEALGDTGVPAPVAVLRRCIVRQAGLFSPDFQRLAVGK